MNIKLLIINVLIVFILSFIVMLFSKNIKNIADKSIKPSYYPPSYLFGIVWSILFIIYGYMLYDIYDNKKDKKQYILAILLIIITLLWTPIFTNTSKNRYRNSFYYIFFVLILNILFFIYSKSLYIVPQILWVSFATFLSYKLYKLNEDK